MSSTRGNDAIRSKRWVGRAVRREETIVTKQGKQESVVHVSAAAVIAAATLGAAGSAPAATKWLCGPGVEHDPCRPRLSTTSTAAGTPGAGRHAEPRARRASTASTSSDGLRQAEPAGDQGVDPKIRSIARYQAARFSSSAAVRARVPAGDRPGAPGRDDDASGLADGLRRRRGGVRRVPRRIGGTRLRPPRRLAGELHLQRLIPGASTTTAPRRRLVSAVLSAATSASVRSRIGGARSPRADLPAADAARLRDRVQHVQRVAAGSRDLRPRGEPCRRLPRAAGRERSSRTACTNPAALGRPRSVALDHRRPDGSRSPPGTLTAAGISLLGLQWRLADDVVQSEGR